MKPPAPARAFSPGYARYVLFILLLVNVFNFIDRQILAIVAVDIKAEMRISDTALGFLLGLAFTAFYTIAGIPIARLADRSSRRAVIAVGFTVWSAMTIACGQARSFAELALARFGVGVGEAAGTPPSHSLISDYFPPERRATAISIHTQGVFIGVMFGFLVGGLIRDAFDWRTAFLAAGLPGLPLALLLYFTVREPRRGASEHLALDAQMPPLSEVFRYLFARRAFVFLTLAACGQAIGGYSVISWGPTFLNRVHGMSATEIGTSFGLLAGAFGALGTLLGGLVADRMARQDVRWYLWWPTFASLSALPFGLLFYLSDGRAQSLAGFAVFYMLSSVYSGPMWTLAQNLVKLRMRSVAPAVLLTLLNLAGMGLGPLLVGLLNDRWEDRYGSDAVRYSLSVMAAIGAVSGLFLLGCARTLQRDLVSRPGDASAP